MSGTSSLSSAYSSRRLCWIITLIFCHIYSCLESESCKKYVEVEKSFSFYSTGIIPSLMHESQSESWLSSELIPSKISFFVFGQKTKAEMWRPAWQLVDALTMKSSLAAARAKFFPFFYTREKRWRRTRPREDPVSEKHIFRCQNWMHKHTRSISNAELICAHERKTEIFSEVPRHPKWVEKQMLQGLRLW